MEAAERTQTGFTLVELMSAIAVATLLVAAALPAFDELQREQVLRGVQHEFLATLHYAKQAAVTSNRRVSLCPSADGAKCLKAGTWHRGWMVFVDRDADRSPDPGEPVLSRQGGLDQALTLTSSRYRRIITFQPTGTAGGSNATFTVCAGTERAAAVVLSRLGRIRLDEGDTDDCPAES